MQVANGAVSDKPSLITMPLRSGILERCSQARTYRGLASLSEQHCTLLWRRCVMHADSVLRQRAGSAGMNGRLRLVAGRGSVSEGFAFGRLEVFLRGFWSNICSDVQTPFPPESAKVACRGLGYDGGEPLLFGLPYSSGLDSPVRRRIKHNCVCELSMPAELEATG